MEPILDETSLEPCTSSPGVRISQLAQLLQALDRLGFRPTLRSTKDAADRDILHGRGLKNWCFDRDTPRDAGLLVASRLSKQPFIDGVDGLFEAQQCDRLIEAKLGGISVMGLGLAALTDSPALALSSKILVCGGDVSVDLDFLGEDEEESLSSYVLRLVDSCDAQQYEARLRNLLEQSVRNGSTLAKEIATLFPRLVLGPRAEAQLSALTGNEPEFVHIIAHLRCLDVTSSEWQPNTKFTPSIRFSEESKETLKHKTYGPMRDFPMPFGHELTMIRKCRQWFV